MKRKIEMIMLGLSVMAMLAGCANPAEDTSSTASAAQPVSSGVDSVSDDKALGAVSMPLPISQDISESVLNYPRVDGSTASLPMMAEVMSTYCKIPLAEAEALVSASGTDRAWSNIIFDADLLMVYPPSASTRDHLDTMKEKWGHALEEIPVALDALVFVTNDKNPVDNLSSQQLLDIYTGEITNWQEVGGEDLPIRAFQRNLNSGSQTMFLSLLMQGVEPMEPPTEHIISGMGDLINVMAFDESASAIGFSVYYYASEMYAQPGLKILSVDGVTPSNESIQSGAYPFVDEISVVIREAELPDSPARQLRDWLLSDEGTDALVRAGYVPAAR